MAGFRIRAVATGVAAVCAASAFVSMAPAANAAQAARAPRADQALDWVALGDSYTAGVIKAAGDEFEDPRDGCARTDQSYPEVIRRDLGPRVRLRNVSCGGATIADIVDRAQRPTGLHAPPLSTDPDHPFARVPAQLSRVSRGTDIVTVGVGANTLGVGEIARTCFALGEKAHGRGHPCKDHYADEMNERLYGRVAAEYDEMLRAIHAKAPSAKVVTVGYPYVIPADTSKCRYGSLAGFGTVTREDLDWLRTGVLEALNRVIKNESDGYGVDYVDLYGSGRGHSVCEKAGGQNWVDGIYTRFPDQPAMIHPNAKGHANAARRIENAILRN